MAFDAVEVGVFHAEAKLNRPLNCALFLDGPPRLQVIGQAHPSSHVRCNVLHRDEYSARKYPYPSGFQNERVFIETHPQMGFPLKGVTNSRIRQEFIPESLKGDGFTSFLVTHKINDSESTPAQYALHDIFTTDQIALGEKFTRDIHAIQRRWIPTIRIKQIVLESCPMLGRAVLVVD